MKHEEFVNPAAGRVVRTPQGYHAFVPASLPPRLEWDTSMVALLSRADAALSELSGVARLLPNPHLLIAPYVRREAVLSSRIEGTKASLSDLMIDELGEQSGAPPLADDVQEVRNYVAALEYGLERLKTLPLSLRLVCELHERLMKGVRGDRAQLGRFRASQNWIGPTGSTIASASYVPPPVVEMNAALDKWERFLHEREHLPVLVQCALMHEHFEAIHPFLDGNGRVGRLLITLFLVERGRLSQPLLYLSSYIEARRQDYYGLLQRVRTHGDWDAWIRYFLSGVESVSREAVAQAAKLLELRERLRSDLRTKPRVIPLIDELFQNPYVTVSRAQGLLGVSNPTARSHVNLLLKRGILEEVGARSWGKLYVAWPILDVLREGD